MIDQVDIRKSENGGWMVRLVGADDRTLVAQRVGSLAHALHFVNGTAPDEELFLVNE